ncbi:MAG: 30S ribosomal protein S4e [Candidatus Aenigmarchaeota archaeon]|nr:30S ribosomal protein S4e [Candidatus Aenigmarchaeota archaeon]
MKHLKRLSAPKFWKLPTKTKVFAAVPKPGPHPKNRSMTLLTALRDVLGLAETAREARSAITAGKVLVDGKPRKDLHFPVGLFDSLSMPEIGSHYRMVPSKDGLELQAIDASSAASKLCVIRSKTVLPKGGVQLGLHDGRTLLAKEAKYKVGDSLLLQVPAQKIVKHYPFAENETAFVIDGRNAGRIGTISSIKKRTTMLERGTIVLAADGEDIKTVAQYVVAGEPTDLGLAMAAAGAKKKAVRKKKEPA